MFLSLTCKAVFWISTWEKACAENLALISLSPSSLAVSGITLGNSKSLQELNEVMLHFNLLISENYPGFRSSLGVHTLSDMGCTETFSEQAALVCTLVPHCSGRHNQSIKPGSFHTCSTCMKLVSTAHGMWVCWGKVPCLMWHPGHPKPAFAMCGTDMRPPHRRCRECLCMELSSPALHKSVKSWRSKW